MSDVSVSDGLFQTLFQSNLSNGYINVLCAQRFQLLDECFVCQSIDIPSDVLLQRVLLPQHNHVRVCICYFGKYLVFCVHKHSLKSCPYQ